MKKIILLCLFFSSLASHLIFAQTQEELVVKEKMWGDQFEGFQLTKAPEKWKDESVVVLGRTYDYEVRKSALLTYLFEGVYLHERLALQDKAAIEKYSELKTGVAFGRKGLFNYTSMVNEVYVGVKIIKPDGTIRELDTKDAVVKEIESNGQKAEYRSIAIPGLEVGDILDYYFGEKRTSINSLFEKFDTQYIPLASEYPIVSQRINLNIMRRCYLLAKSINGAPELKLSSESDRGEMIYSLVDRDRDKLEYEDYHWVLPRREVPMLKFEAYFTSKKGMKVYPNYAFFLNNKQELKSSLNDEEIVGLVRWGKKYLKKSYLELDKFMAGNYKKETDINVLIEEAYYFFRQNCYRDGFEDAHLHSLNKTFGIVDWAFVAKMSNFFDKRKIKHDFIVTGRRWNTGLDDLTLYDELAFLLRVHTPKPIYLTNFDRFSLYDEFDPGFQGNDAYVINLAGKGSLTKLGEKLPVSSDNSSVSSTVMHVSLSAADMQQMVINENVSMTGGLRSQHIPAIVTPYEYINDCKNEKYDTPLLLDAAKNNKAKRELEKGIAAKINEDNHDRLTAVEQLIKDEFGLKNDFDIDSVRVVSSGLWSESPALKYSVDYRINEFVNKVGPNYLLEIGKLMGGQIAIDDKEVKNRNLDVYFPFARAYENEISIAIPDGYEVNGIEGLACDFSNEYCEFQSSAKLASNKLVFKTKKAYKTNFMEAEHWNDLLDMLNAATKISEQKVLLKKI